MIKKEFIPYNTDASRLEGKAVKVLFPQTKEEIQKIIKSSNFDIVPRGAGSGLVGGCIPDNSIIVDMSKMNDIFNFNLLKKTIYAGAGITLKELNEKLSSTGFEFPIQPLNKGISTIGGMIATNAVGDKSMRYGRMKDWVEGVEFINGRGELMRLGKTDLLDVCGMEGITGIIISATLRITPIIKRTASVFKSDKLTEILSIARRLKAEKEVVMIELLPPIVSKWFGFQEKYHLIIEFDSERGKINGEEYNNLMKLKNNTYSILASEGYYQNEDSKFFFDKLGEFISFLENNQIPYVGFPGTGYLHSFFKDEEQNKKEAVIKLIQKMGIKPPKYGIGLNKKYLVDSFEKKILQRVKLRYDPFGKLNKNKMIDNDFSASEIKKSAVDKPIHLKPLGKKEIEEIRPILEEEKSAAGLIQERESNFKTPEEKIEEFIKEIEKEDMKNQKLKKKEDIDEKEEIEEKQEVENRLKDYEYTFKSEIEEEKRKKVEELAKNISKDFGNKKNPDYRTIQDIMTNNYNNSRDTREREKEHFQKPKTSESEQEMINKIMGNRFDSKKENKNDN